MEKVLFALEIDEDGYPPVGTEGVWCERIENNYKLVNTPFFIRQLASGDVFSAEPDSVNGHVFDFKIIEKSGHSVVWVLNNKAIETTQFISQIELLGCRVEGLSQISLYSIDAPPHIDLKRFDEIIETWKAAGLDFAFPTWRLES